MALPSFASGSDARLHPGKLLVAIALLAVLAGVAQGQPLPRKKGGEAAPARFGRLIAVPLPLTGPVASRVERMINSLLNDRALQNQQPVIALEFRPRGRDAGAGSDLGSAVNLARFLTGRQASRAHTVAYIPETIKGHALLVVMACDEIIVHPDAHLGDAGADEKVLTPDVRDFYSRIADARKTIPKAVALKMLDRNLELLQVETETSREFVLREDLERLRAEKAVKAEQRVVSAAGEPGWFSGAEARELGLASFLAEDRNALAVALGLSRDKLEQDPSLDGSQWRPIAVPLKGPMTAQKVSRAQRLIEDQIQQRDVNLICLWLDSPGGAPEESAKLANYLADLDPGQRRTVAFIPSEARADAAFIALACDQIVMQEGAVLGGVGAAQIDDADVQVHVQVVREIAERKFRSPSLAAAILDPNLQVFRYTREADGLVQYLSADDAAELPDRERWQRGPEVTELGKPLHVDPERGRELGMVHDVVGGFGELRDIYHLEGNPQFVEPGWADTLIDTLSSPQVAWLLLLIGGAAVYIEAKTPGIGLGGLIGALCFLVFFWARFLGGTAEWLEVLLFLAGIGLLLIELFVLPGFGVFGLMGGLCVVSSVVLASQTFYIPRNDYQLGQFRDSMVSVAAAGVGIVAAIAMLRRFLPHTPMFNQVMLEPPKGTELESIASHEALASFAHLLGMRGAAATPLTPAGKARFGDQLVDVVSDGEFIERGTEVVVVQTRANRVVVKPV